MRAMIGEWTGKVRSTPTPKLTFRTVNDSRTPAPWRRITAPWNTWMRSRLPSTTRTWTFTVSPGAKWGTSERRAVRSTRSVGFMARQAPAQRRSAGGMFRIAELVEEPALGGSDAAAGFDQVGTAVEGPGQGLGPPP